MDTLSTPGWVWAMILGAAAAMAAGVPAGLRLALRSRDEWRQGGLVPASFAILGGWLVLTYVLAAAGVYRAGEERLPTILPAILGPILAGWFLVARSLRSAVEAVPQEALLAAQTPRVLGGVFLALAAMGALPPHFALPAGIGDVLVGALAPFVAWAYRSNPGRGRRLAVGFNLLGLADFALAVGIGFSAAPSPFRLLQTAPSTELMTVLPLVLVPVFLVPLFAVIHLASLAGLLRTSSGAVPGTGGRRLPGASPQR